MNALPQIILASSSSTRQALLARLHLPFICISPEIDESPQTTDTSANALAIRLAQEKANCIAIQHPDAVVIGSDQVAYFSDQPHVFIGKPYTEEQAIEQLRISRKRTLHFVTAFTVQCQSLGVCQTINDQFSVTFRDLTDDEITRYVTIDQPLHCAGSFKCEGLGISLFEQMQGDDFTTLMGLPLIKLSHQLRMLHFPIP